MDINEQIREIQRRIAAEILAANNADAIGDKKTAGEHVLSAGVIYKKEFEPAIEAAEKLWECR